MTDDIAALVAEARAVADVPGAVLPAGHARALIEALDEAAAENDRLRAELAATRFAFDPWDERKDGDAFLTVLGGMFAADVKEADG